MIEAYCDESGIHDGAPYCVVVGFVGSVRNWHKFDESWRKASGGVNFHGQRFFGRSAGKRVKPYDGWSDQKARKYLVDLVETITATNFRPIGGVVDVAAFNALTIDERRYLTGAAYRPFTRKFTTTGAPSKPFFVGFSECLGMASRNTKKPGWKVNIIWDRQNEFAGHANSVFQTALRLGVDGVKNRLGELIFKDKEGVAGLQAADLLAHACYKRADLDVGANEELDMVTVRLRTMTHRKIVHFDGDTLRNRLERVHPEIRHLWHAKA